MKPSDMLSSTVPGRMPGTQASCSSSSTSRSWAALADSCCSLKVLSGRAVGAASGAGAASGVGVGACASAAGASVAPRARMQRAIRILFTDMQAPVRVVARGPAGQAIMTPHQFQVRGLRCQPLTARDCPPGGLSLYCTRSLPEESAATMQAGRAPRFLRPSGPAAFPRTLRRAFWRLVVRLLAFIMPAGAVVTFPGPNTAAMSQPCLSVLAVRLPGETTDDLVVGMAGGNPAFWATFPRQQRACDPAASLLGGSLVGDPEQGPWPIAGSSVAARDPDCVYFLRLADSYPYLQLEQTVELDEDPGTLAWFGDIPGGEGQLAVSLPGMDAIAQLADDDGWRVRQTITVGDDPYSLAAADLDGDGRPEVVAAQRGLLSGNLAVLTAAEDGPATVRIVEAPGLTAGFVCAWDGDGDGIAELAVADRQAPRLGLLRVAGAGFVSDVEITLTMPARQLTMWTLADGQPALLASDVDRGAAEFASRTAEGWVRHATYYPGCLPVALAVGEFNGDGLPDVTAAASGGSFLAWMMARPGPEPGFWGLPALTLSSSPGDQTQGDFNGDGRIDVMVASALEPRLSLFVALEDGGMSTLAIEHELGFTPGKLEAIELDGDAESELAVLDIIAGQVVLLDAVAGGGFAETQRIDVGSFPAFLTSGDIDADGSVDLLALPSDGTRVQLLFGEPGGGFQAPVTLTYEIATTRAVLFDLNGDGRLDVAGVDGASRLWWRINLGGRDFGPGQWLHVR
ncbi:MAG: VCBS repeat-containing protein [bacterium]|nr:VCBS repeat-containing protein [bacterium]